MDTISRSKVKRVAIVGPECSGKTTLAEALARHYQTVWVPEYARDYLERLSRPYTQDDLLVIAHGQIQLEDEYAQRTANLLICDTNLLVIKIWSEFKYGTCHPEILHHLHNRHYDLHLLTHPDVPWQDDPQREHPDKRDLLFSIYKSEINKLNVRYEEIFGPTEERMKRATLAIDSILLCKH
ncbi:MAG: ATP-binding protein [Cyclobacteriaceae bacterium]|nr:ATP-binding protein [Cyclobacteriaceae bacterium]